ncbi:SDR family oxidoreductase [Patescibacteria group bacterium]|nr:SDR family oxidoreductase [Patescibacteria group bacterium]
MKNKYLVTGGAGFIGSNLVKKLLESNNYVRVVDNFSTGKKENIEEFLNNKNFELIEGDISNPKTTKGVVKNIDFVFHEAAIPSVPRSINNPFASNKANIDGTLNVLIAARDANVKKLVYASSSSIYGDSVKLPKQENDPINPISPYALTKLAGERYCQLFAQLYKLPTICLRYFNVFGPKQDPNSEYSAVIPIFIKSILDNRQPTIYGDGEQSRDFTYVDNVVNANILAMHSDISGEVMNIACGEKISLNDLLKYINQLLSKNIEAVYEKHRDGDVKHSLADISKAKKLIKYKPLIDIKIGINKTVKWIKESIKS